MPILVYARIDGEDAAERKANALVASKWVKDNYGVQPECTPYGLRISMPGVPVGQAGPNAKEMAARLSRENNVSAVSRTDPVSDARNGAVDPWPGTLKEGEVGHRPAQSPGVEESRPTHLTKIEVSPRRRSKADESDWGSLTPATREIIAVLSQAEEPLRRIDIQHDAGVSREMAQKVLAQAVENGLVVATTDSLKERATPYRITPKGLEAAPTPTTPKDEHGQT
jgi:DNA-binding MarR family transcriptional regulator